MFQKCRNKTIARATKLGPKRRPFGRGRSRHLEIPFQHCVKGQMGIVEF